jgi:hypothetical protein
MAMPRRAMRKSVMRNGMLTVTRELNFLLVTLGLAFIRTKTLREKFLVRAEVRRGLLFSGGAAAGAR